MPDKSHSLWWRVGTAVSLIVWTVSGFILANLGLVVLVIFLRQIGVPFEKVNQSVLDATAGALTYLLAVLITIKLPDMVGRFKTTLADLGLARGPRLADIIVAAPVGYLSYFVLTAILTGLAANYLPGYDINQAQEVGFKAMSHQYEYVLAFLTLVVVAPFAEEVLMRGYLYGKLRKLMPVIVAMILTGVVFGALHGQVNVAVDVFALSLVMTTLRETTDSIWAGVVLHMMKNGLAFYILFINPVFLNTIGG